MTGERANRATATSTKLTHRIRFGTFFARRRIKIRLFANDNDGEDPNLENIQPIKIYTLDMDIKELKKQLRKAKEARLGAGNGVPHAAPRACTRPSRG